MNTRTSKVRRRARLALAVLAGALVLPGLAAADHYECQPGSPTDPCGKFDPKLGAGAQVPLTDTPSSISFRFNQDGSRNHDQPVLGVKYLVPKGWQFAVNSLRPSEISEGPNIGTGPATQCKDVILGEQNDTDGTSARLGRAENLFGGVGVAASTDARPRSNPYRFGYTFLGPNEGGENGEQRRQDPSLAFLGYNGTNTVNMCLYLYANDFVGIAGDEPFFGLLDDVREYAREHIIPVTMTRVAAGEMMGSEDISLKFSWKIEFDLTSFYATDFLVEEAISVVDSLFSIDAISGGNWHVDDTSGQRGSIVFSKTPKVAGEYEFRGIFTTCAEGLNGTSTASTETAEAYAVSALCQNGTLFETSRSIFQKILNPPNANVLDFGKLTGPSGALASAGTPRFGLIRGTNDVTFTWTQPSLPLDEKVKGYVLAIARPGEQDSLHFEYMVTNPDDGDFDSLREPCGPDGDTATCSVTLTFPLNAVASDPLEVDGKYDVALVTLYEGAGASMDKRSDGFCDDGTGYGTDCPFTDPAYRVDIHRAFDMNRVPGISTWQFMLREKAWPVVFARTESFSRSGGGPSFTSPRYVLLVDFSLRQGEFVIWNPLGFEERFFAPSNLIQGDNSAGGLVSFQSTAMTGHTLNWRFDGRIVPAGGGPVLTVGGEPVGPTLQAFGAFLQYDLKGLPGAMPPGGLPGGRVVSFSSNAKL